MLTLENLNLKSRGLTLFTGLSVTIFPGSIIILRGENGAGKTTLLRMISGITPVQEGRILLDGLDIVNIQKPYANYIGHNLGNKLELTVKENIEKVARLYCSQKAIPAAMHYFDLNEHADYKIHQLSAGNQKKIAISRLLACQTELWLLDEVETNLDDYNRKLLAACIESKASSGGIIIIATHQDSSYIEGQVINLKDFKYDSISTIL